jgi:hypothetical protein
MILHVLPGDAIVSNFTASRIEGEIAVCRECFVVGDLSGSTLPELWENRARFLAAEYTDAGVNYHEAVVREFAKLTALQSDSQINLWFEYELFCQTNMWFCLSLLAESTADIYRVAPVTLPDAEQWEGFGNLTPNDLKECFDARVKLSQSEIELGADLWSAYRSNDRGKLEELSTIETPAFPKLREVCIAAIEKESRPAEIVREIIQDGETDFAKIFSRFKARAGVYGYGDSQVKNIWRGLVV